MKLSTMLALLLLTLPRFAAAEEFWGCELKITGDQKLTINAPQLPAVEARQKTIAEVQAASKVSAGTDYWMTDDNLRTALDAMIGAFSGMSFGKTPKPKITDEERKKKVDEAMKKDPRLVLLLFNCGNEQAGVNIAPSSASKYSDVPFKPGSYKITADRKAGNFSAMMHIQGAKGHESYSVTAPGTIKITQFDLKGLGGEFTFGAEQMTQDKKKIQVAGSFHYRCAGQKCQP